MSIINRLLRCKADSSSRGASELSGVTVYKEGIARGLRPIGMCNGAMRRFSTSSRLCRRKNSVDDVFRSLPRVPTTRFLESQRLSSDILFSGYRPVMYPVRENPLFGRGRAPTKAPAVLEPRLQPKDIRYDLWSTTTMGLEKFPEWSNVPREVVRKLRPFDRHNS